MLKSLRLPEVLFRLSMWLVSLLLAGFLVGLGGKVIADLPRLESQLTVDQFAQASLAATRREIDQLVVRERDLSDRQEQASLALAAVANAYRSARSSYSNWITTRT